MEPRNTDASSSFSGSRDLLSGREAWIEGAFWIAEERRARLRAEPTEEAFARLAFELCVRRTQDLEPR